MNTVIIAVSLFSMQSPASSSDLLSFNLDEVKQQVRSYLTDDVNAVSKMVQDAIRDGISAGSQFFASDATAVQGAIEQGTDGQEQVAQQQAASLTTAKAGL